MKIFINKTKALLSGIVFLFTGGYGIYYLLHDMFPEWLIFLGIAFVFGYQCYKNASVITIDRDYIRRTFLGIVINQAAWTEIRELGLIGENVFSKKKDKTGDKYIYFSPYEMTKEERFDMIAKWPPKDILYMEYGERQLEYAMVIWGKELKTYNVEDLFPTTENASS